LYLEAPAYCGALLSVFQVIMVSDADRSCRRGEPLPLYCTVAVSCWVGCSEGEHGMPYQGLKQ
jgi:hypothetical protein